MPDLTIQIHANGPADLQTSDAATVEALGRAYAVTPALVGVRELALVLRVAKQDEWADRLDALEEAHMVTVHHLAARPLCQRSQSYSATATGPNWWHQTLRW